MTREQFDKLVSIKTRQGAHLGRSVATFSLAAEMEFDASIANAEKHVEEILRERLWDELYGRRAERFHELLDELARNSYPTCNFKKYRSILTELHEVAPLESKALETTEYASCR